MPNRRQFKRIPGSICAPRGFRAAAVFCDIKTLGTGKGSDKGRKRDLALIVSDVPAAVAGMFTANKVSAAPVKLSAKRAAKKFGRAIVVNSGNANACTGKQGMRDAEAMTRITAVSVAAVYDRRKSGASFQLANQDRSQPRRSRHNSAVADRRYRIVAENILVCSTGRIGVPMPMKNVERGIRQCAPVLGRSAKHARQVAEAIMTTDTQRKEIALEFKIDDTNVRIGGICKGAGMIQPGMQGATGRRPVTSGKDRGTKHATMLGFITTDAAIDPSLLKQALADAVERSFNRITVDGDMSTNDSVIILANGLAGNRILKNPDARFQIFQAALDSVCLELAKMIVRDGEGVSRFVALHVGGAKTARDAEAAARAIANSSLVKASWCGGDPNWGRVLCALGYSGANIDESVLDVGYGRPGGRKIVFAFRRGRPTNVALKTLAKITLAPEFDLYVNLHVGRNNFTMYAADLTEEYVAFNKGDVNDPKTLGG